MCGFYVGEGEGLTQCLRRAVLFLMAHAETQRRKVFMGGFVLVMEVVRVPCWRGVF